MGGEWQQLLQSIILGLIFSYLLAKLIAIVISFKEENLSLTRARAAAPADTNPPPLKSEPRDDQLRSADLSSAAIEAESVVAEHGSVRNDSSEADSDDDWEGVESTELDELFSAATAFVAAAAVDRQKVSSDAQLKLYGLYKIATEGPCSAPQPSALKMTARAKWQAWQKLGAMPPEDAMEKYIDIVTELYPNWAAGLTVKSRGGEGSASGNDSKGPMGPVFSTFVYEEESEKDLKMDAIHAFAREGEVDNLLKCIESGVSVDQKDSEGRTPLHWAVDRGHLNMTELLVSKNANVNEKDNEGQTALHYAVMCDREGIAEFLVKQNADTSAKDNDGNSPCDVCESNWPWFQGAKQKSH
ncbi:acyl-CoA-binding domain-containing protein 1-like [Pyrus ussuriensis x Pyrus communis]|uniref:Acyl-CoA-binding domain-containing protein 1-like n=1 Tax=Pyrus ussuriensis x Pyrus communis TaxID=2448454 RepID=A0A5N5FEF2_9ROSA|nr:acyl-CoA-binding domain-containing protein 1-like isoform X1 [Pyrus x bretschneideri]KAB2596834.1 acyl-CoA-binding domain-containing protein 1-like [Pyrus ussuriensis x Pyrus communis]